MNKLRVKSMSAGLVLLLAGVLTSFVSSRGVADRETRSVGAFTEVNLSGSSRVVLKQGSPQSVVVEGRAADIAAFETVVTGRSLRVGYPRTNNDDSWKNRESVTVYITAPTLTALRVNGSGRLNVEGALKAEEMALTVSGSGDLQVPQLTATSLRTEVDGSGSVLVAGRAPRHDVTITGSANVKARDLKAESCKVRISGSGNANVYATKNAEASISGSGNVAVAGGAQLSSSVRGSGRMHQE
ncbi:MAG TPA: head GIN domain-containing protein [Hymenobacter sp.]|jgi:hypothetical protein|uniref:head GIN domain-containing protein n=1 Tax=Hymenobacter sp. TaxID=1898978 RepID=UPI002ED9167B